MRHLTTITGKSTAETFVAYLLTQDISTHVEPGEAGSDQWNVWIRDEDRNSMARAALEHFQSNPDDPKYRQAIEEAKSILKDKRQKSIERVKNVQRMPMRVNPALFSGPMPPLTLTLIVLCVLLGIVSEFSSPSPGNALGKLVYKQLSFVDEALFRKTHDPAASLKQGELWRILTPAFLHGGPLHLLLNMMSLASLGRVTERLEGTGRFAIILVIVGMVSHLLQGLMPTALFGSPHFVGISGLILGLLGYLGAKTTLRPDMGFTISPQMYIMTGLILVLGFSSSMQDFPMANLAHLGGLLAGAAVGFVMSDRRFDR